MNFGTGKVCVLMALLAILQTSARGFAVDDSVKARIKKEVETYPLEPDQLFTEAPGLTRIMDSTYKAVLDNIRRNKETYRIKYPLVLNRKEFSEKLETHRRSLNRKIGSGQAGQMITALDEKERSLELELFDGIRITAICDRVYKILDSDMWGGHVKGKLVSRVVISSSKKSGEMLITIDINGKPPFYFTSFGDTNVFLLRQEGPPHLSGPDCLVPDDNHIQ